MTKRYLVTVIETYLVEAETKEEAVEEVAELRPGRTGADTSDVQVELVAA